MHQDIEPSQLLPGTVIAVCYSMYKHFAIISDRSMDGTPNLISLSYRTSRVKEESWNTVVGNRLIEKSLIKGHFSQETILSRARSCMSSNTKYELLTFNCEHFVRYAHGLPVESVQVKQALYGAAFGAASCVLLPNITAARFAILTTAGAVSSLRKSLHKL